MCGSALEAGAVFEGEGQAAIRVGRGVVQQAAPELFAEGGDLAVLLLQDMLLFPVYVTSKSSICCFPRFSVTDADKREWYRFLVPCRDRGLDVKKLIIRSARNRINKGFLYISPFWGECMETLFFRFDNSAVVWSEG